MSERRKEKKKRDKPAAPEGKPARTRRSWAEIMAAVARLFALPLASAAMLTMALPPLDASWVAYLALAPLVVMVARSRSNRDAFWAAGVGGLAFFAANLSWIRPITIAGYIALILYMAAYWAVFGWGLRRMKRATALPLTVLAPVLWVALEYVRGFGPIGMPWLYVGHTQYANLTLIQSADSLGAYGPSFLCLMTSGLIADLLTHPLFVRRPVAGGAAAAGNVTPTSRSGLGTDAPACDGVQWHEPQGDAPHFSRTLTAMILLTAAAWAATVGYGVWRMGQYEKTAHAGPVVAVAQTCVPQEVKREARLRQIEEAEQQMINEQLVLTDEAVAEADRRGLAPQLVVWPETMVPGYLNRSFLEGSLAEKIPEPDMRGVFEHLRDRSRVYWEMIRDKAEEVGAPILCGASSVEMEGAYRVPGGGFLPRGARYNTAILIAPDTAPYGNEGSYAKAHLVPFGEYMPLVKQIPWFFEWLQQSEIVPYKYDYSITPGKIDQPPFTLKFDGREAHFQVAICYEDAMAYRIRRMTKPMQPAPQTELTAPGAMPPPQVAAGNKAIDFVVNISNDGWFNGSIELDQHLNLCAFRAVENRVAIVRSVNTGISAIIAPTGRIEQVVERDGRRRGIAGEMVGRLTFDDRVAPYTRVGDVFALACVAASAAMAVAVVIHARRRRRAA